MVWPILANPILANPFFVLSCVVVGVDWNVCVVVRWCVFCCVVVSCGCLSCVVVVRWGVRGCGSCWWCGCWFGPLSPGPLSPGPLSAGPPKISLFFPSPALIFVFFLSLGVFSWNSGGVCESWDPPMCSTFGLSGCRVKPRRKNKETQKQNTQRVFFWFCPQWCLFCPVCLYFFWSRLFFLSRLSAILSRFLFFFVPWRFFLPNTCCVCVLFVCCVCVCVVCCVFFE